MKKRNYVWNLLTIVLSVTLSFVLSSCSSDDDSENLENKNQGNESVISEELKPFIGYWYNESGIWDLLLLENGKCMATNHNLGGTLKEGVWTYDKDTKYLTNTATNNTYLLTLYDDTQILGVNLSDNKTISYVKDEYNKEVLDLIMNGDWISTNGEHFKYNYYDGNFSYSMLPELPKNTSRIRYKGYIMGFWADSDDNDGEYNYIIRYEVEEYEGYPDYRWYPSTRVYYEGKVYIENLYNPSKCKVTFTGVIEGTYTRADM